MNKNFSVKGLCDRGNLSNKNLQNMYTSTSTGSISSNFNIEELFEVTIESNITDISSIIFQDMNLNIFNCKFTFNIIGIDNLNKGIFFKYDYNCTITYKSFNTITYCNLLLVDSYFYKRSNLNIDFSLVIALDFSKDDNISFKHINPLADTNTSISFSDSTFSLFFDKEFI